MVVGELLTKLGFQYDEQSAKTAEAKTKKFGMGLKLAIAGAVAGVAALGKSAIGAAADMEMLTTQFEVMLGSSEKAVAMMDDLKEFSAATPFALEDLAKGSQQLLSFGVAQEDVLKTMQMLGDTAGGDAEKLNGLVLAYGKVQTKGKASMEELNMMAERGLPILDILKEQTGLTGEAFFKAVSAGEISQENIRQAFETMTSSGGMFFEGMKKQSETLHGLISTMQDNFKLLLADVGAGFLPVMKQINTLLIGLAQGTLKELAKNLTNSLLPVLELVIDLLPKLIDLVNPVITELSVVITELVGIIAGLLEPAFKILAPLIRIISKIINVIANVLRILNKPLVEFGNILGNTLAPILDKVADKFIYIANLFMTYILPVFAQFINTLMPLIDMFFKQVMTILMPVIDELMKILVELFIALAPILDVVLKVFLELATLFLNILVPVLKFIMPIFTWIIRTIGNIVVGLAKFFGWFYEKIGWLVDLVTGDKGKDDKIEIKQDEMPTQKLELGKEPITLKVDPPKSSSQLATNNLTNRSTSVNMQNNITVSGDLTNQGAIKQNMQQVAESIFNIQLKKVLASAEL